MRGIDIEFVLAPFFVSPPHSPESSPTRLVPRKRDATDDWWHVLNFFDARPHLVLDSFQVTCDFAN